MVATARALMARPRVLLMDEPSMGLSPVMVEQCVRDHPHDQRAGRHHPPRRAERVAGAQTSPITPMCMESGRIVLSGRGTELLDDEKVQRAYLG